MTVKSPDLSYIARVNGVSVSIFFPSLSLPPSFPLSPSLSLPPSLSHLCDHIGQVNGLLQVAHHHEVPGLVPSIVEGVVVDVTENGTSSDPGEVRRLAIVYKLRELRQNCRSSIFISLLHIATFSVFLFTTNRRAEALELARGLWHSISLTINLGQKHHQHMYMY